MPAHAPLLVALLLLLLPAPPILRLGFLAPLCLPSFRPTPRGTSPHCWLCASSHCISVVAPAPPRPAVWYLGTCVYLWGTKAYKTLDPCLPRGPPSSGVDR